MMNRRKFLARVGAASAAASLPWEAASLAGVNPSEKSAVQLKLEAFEYRGVRLLPGLLRRQVEQTRETYFNLSNDDILKGFRRDARLPAPGNDLKGWARLRCDATFGQWLSGMARLSCALDDGDLRDKAIALVEGWKKTLPPDANCRMSTYAYEKMACGLVDLALYAGYNKNLSLLEDITAWARDTFDRSRTPATSLDRDGHEPKGTLEWYTLSENLYRAYLLTDKDLFRDFGKLWEYTSYWDKFLDSSSPAGVEFLHSYSHINTFCGAAMAYAMTGNDRYLRILKNGYDFVTRTQAYASGGYGPGEWSVPADGQLGRALEIRSDSAEIPCGCWAGFKLSRYLLGYTADSQYSDWLETLLYNGIAASLPVLPDGRSFYYADYRLGSASKLYYWDEWPCCSGTYIQTVADYHNIIYFKDDRGLFVNLFVPSEVTWTRDHQAITIRQETRFPESDDINFQVRCERPVKFSIRIRMPSWSETFELKVNDEAIELHTETGHWAAVDREWKPGDQLKLKVACTLRLAPVDPQHPRRAAIKYGPILLAQEARFTYPLELKDEDLAKKLIRETDDLHFRVSDSGVREQRMGAFQPFYQVRERVPYRVYFDLDEARFL